jgi:hypothetical protein
VLKWSGGKHSIRSLCYREGMPNKSQPQKTNSYATHETFLQACLDHLEKSGSPYQVLEFGTGGRSSEIISAHTSKSRYAKYIAFESDEYYLIDHKEKYSSDRTRLVSIDASNSWFKAIKDFLANRTQERIGLVFVDSSPWESRTLAVSLLAEEADFVMVHDVDYFPREGSWGLDITPMSNLSKAYNKAGRLSYQDLGIRNYGDVFKSWVECFEPVPAAPTGPPTLIGSRSLDVDEISLPNSSLFIRSSAK